MESTGWFVVAGILGLFGFFSLYIMCDFKGIARDVIAVTGILLAVASLACDVMGFRAPDKMPVQVVVKEPSEEMVMKAAKKLLSEMSVQEKYKILENAEMEK